MVIFKFKQKKFEVDLKIKKIKLCGKTLYPNESVKGCVCYIFARLFFVSKREHL